MFERIKVKLEGDPFFGEEVEIIDSREEVRCNEKILTEIFIRKDGGFIIKKSFSERQNPDPSYDVIDANTARTIADYFVLIKGIVNTKKWNP